MVETSRTSTATDGIRFIDASRESFSFLLDQMFNPQAKCPNPGGTCSRIEDTIRFLSRNLQREERLMAETGYPGLAAHRRDHELMLRKLKQMTRTLICGSYNNALVSDFLTEWTRNHVVAFDNPFVDFLRDRGMKPIQGEGQ